jgi:chromosome segregation ATPase
LTLAIEILIGLVASLGGLGLLLVGALKVFATIVEKLSTTLDKTIDQRIAAEDERLKEKEARLALESQIVDLKREQGLHEVQQAKQLQQIEVLEKNYDASKEILRNWEGRIDTLEAEREDLKSKLAEAQQGLNENAALKSKVEHLEGEVARLNGLLENAQRENATLSGQIEALRKNQQPVEQNTAMFLTAPPEAIRPPEVGPDKQGGTGPQNGEE